MGILSYDKQGGASYVEVSEHIKGALGMVSKGGFTNQFFVVGGDNKTQIADALRAEAPHIFVKDTEEISDPKMYAPGKIYAQGQWACVNLDQEGKTMNPSKIALLYVFLEKSGITGEDATDIRICKEKARHNAKSAFDILHLDGSPEKMMSIEVKGPDAEDKAMHVYHIIKEILQMEEK